MDYTSETVYEDERERIWFGGWICAGRDEVPNPGDYLVRDIAGESIFIVRNLRGEPRAFYNVCAHRGTRLVDEEPASGHVSKVFKCPYHAWSFDLDGRLIGTPNVHEDEAFDRESYPLHSIAVEAYAGFVFVTSPRRAAGPGDAARQHRDAPRLRSLPPRRAASGPADRYEVAANWKIVVENYNECLHCPTVHPELVSIVPLYRFGEVWDEETQTTATG